MCAMFLDSKMRPRIVLRQREHKSVVASQSVRKVYEEWEAAHMLPLHADVDLGATRGDAGRGSSDPLQPCWSCPRLTCGDGDPTEEEMGS